MGRFVGAGEWPLIGRSQELHLINSCFDGPSRFAGVAIIGPPGVGKSRLVAEAAASAGNAGAEVRWTVATESARSIPLGAFLPWASGISGNPLRLVSTVIDALATTAHGKPAVIAVDDAHLLDDLSAFVLHQLVLRGAGRVIVSIRTGEPTPDAVTALWKDRHLRLLELQPLSRPESDALLRSALGGPVDDECARRMWHLTNGNVLYLRHVVEQELTARRLCREGNDRWGWQGTPVVSQTLVGLIASHIGSVSEAILDVVDLVAIAEPLEMKILDQLVDPAACDDAERRGLIAVSQAAGGVVASIGHPLYGEARRNQAGPLHLRRLRGRVAAALAAAGSMDHADVVRLGVLWLESDLAPDPELLLRAAQAAMVRLDLALSERLAGASLRAGGGTDAAILRSHALNLLNRSQDAEDLLASLDLEGVTDAQASSIVIVRAANFLWPLARPSDSWDLVETALRRSNPAVRQSLLPMRLVQLAFAARPVEAVAAAESLDLGQLSDLPALVAAWAMVTALGDVGSASKATAVAIEAYERASQSIDAAYQGVGLVEFHVAALLSAGRVTDAVAVAADARRHCADVPGVVSAVTTAVAGMAALGTGRLDLARHQLTSANAVFEAYGDVSAVCYRFTIVTVEVMARLGDVDAATKSLSDMQRRRHPAFTFVEADRMLAVSWAAAARGATTQAIADARRAADFARTHGQLAREVVCLQIATQFGDKSTAARLMQLKALVEGPRVEAAATYAAALAAADGDALRAASAEFEAMGDMLGAADAAAHAAITYRRAGRRGSALSAAARALRISVECGGATSPAVREAARPLPITAREREVVSLIAQGLSNRQIADGLGTSIRTVEGHVYRACRRLDVKDRAALADLLEDSDLA